MYSNYSIHTDIHTVSVLSVLHCLGFISASAEIFITVQVSQRTNSNGGRLSLYVSSVIDLAPALLTAQPPTVTLRGWVANGWLHGWIWMFWWIPCSTSSNAFNCTAMISFMLSRGWSPPVMRCVWYHQRVLEWCIVSAGYLFYPSHTLFTLLDIAWRKSVVWLYRFTVAWIFNRWSFTYCSPPPYLCCFCSFTWLLCFLLVF